MLKYILTIVPFILFVAYFCAWYWKLDVEIFTGISVISALYCVAIGLSLKFNLIKRKV
jgi:hypothetical protein